MVDSSASKMGVFGVEILMLLDFRVPMMIKGSWLLLEVVGVRIGARALLTESCSCLTSFVAEGSLARASLSSLSPRVSEGSLRDSEYFFDLTL